MQTAKAISRLFLWFALGVIAAPLLFGAFDGVYVWLTNRKTLTLQLDPLVIQVLGKYDSLLWPLPLYFLVGVVGGVLGLAFGAYKLVNAPKQT